MERGDEVVERGGRVRWMEREGEVDGEMEVKRLSGDYRETAGLMEWKRWEVERNRDVEVVDVERMMG